MTIADEGKQLKSEVAKLRPDKRRRYPGELRGRILDWVARAEVAGLPIYECGRMLGINTWRFQLWRQEVRGLEEKQPLALVPIETPLPLASMVVVVAPSGHRVEGLSLQQVALLLQELA